MRNLLLILFWMAFIGTGFAQVANKPAKSSKNSDPIYNTDTTSFNKQVNIKIDGKTHYTDYKIISLNNDTTYVDTTLSIQKDYKLNYTRKDNFELMGFANMGETFNNLAYNFQGNDIFPAIGFTAKQFAYYGLNDIYYYSVPTPTSELMVRSGIQQGQVLDAMLTANTSRQFNISVAYKGLRSLGKYRNSLSSHGNFRATFNYTTKNKRYTVRGHMYSFDFYNQQNGGLTPQSLFYFETNNPNYTDRSRLETNFIDADNKFEGKRYYLDQSVALFSNRIPAKVKVEKPKQLVTLDSLQKISRKDSLMKSKPKMKIDSTMLANFLVKDSIQKSKASDSLLVNVAFTKKDSVTIKETNLTSSDSIKPAQIALKDSVVKKDKLSKPFLDFRLGNTLLYETKHYFFNQTTSNEYFGPSFVNEIQDHTSYQMFNGQMYLQLNSAYIGSLRIKTNYFNYNYHYNSILYYEDYIIPDKVSGDALSIGADWNKKLGKISLSGDASTIIIGNMNGSTLKAAVSYQQDSLFTFNGFAEITSKSPNLNTQLYQSDYIDYNWYNNFSNEEITSFGGEFNSEKLATLQASYNFVDNYVYFNVTGLPEQSTETLSYLRVKLIKSITYKKFSLENTVLYQNVTSGQDFFRVPEWTTRNSLYYSTYLFKGKPLYLQTGVTFKYFTKYFMNAYNPLISEFSIQNTDEIGNFPLLDFFFNFQIQRTRFYFKLENFSASFTGRDYFSAPTYPYRDLQFRFGLVWNFFI